MVDKVKPISPYKTAFVLIAVVVGLVLLYQILDIIIIFILAFLVGYAINPLITFFERIGVPRIFSLIGVLLVLIGLLAVAFYFLIPAVINQINSLIKDIPSYIDTLTLWWDRFAERNPYLGKNFDLDAVISHLEKQISQGFQSAILAAQGILSFFFALAVVLVVAFFGLVNPGKIRESVLQLIPSNHYDKTMAILEQINKKIGGYLRGVLIAGVVIGVLSVIGYSILGVNFALTLGIVAGILELVPIVGPIIAGILAVVVALFQDPVLAIYVAIFAFALQQLENHLLFPNIMRRQVGLHPVTIIFVTLIMARFLGIVGIFLAVPIAAIIKILIDEIYKPNIRGSNKET